MSSDTRFQHVNKDEVHGLTDVELLHRYTVLSMQLQEAFLAKDQDFEKQKILNEEFVFLKRNILFRMVGVR